MIRGVLFDLDGTLCHTMPDLCRAMNEMLRCLGYPERSEAELLQCINHGVRHFVAGALPAGASEAEIDRAVAVYDAAYRAHPVDRTQPFPGVAALLAALRAEGRRIGVLSNKQDGLVKTVIGLVFPGVFDPEDVMGPGMYPPKPDPASALAAASRWNLRPEEIAFVGDSDVDMKTAVAAGMLPVGVLWGYRDRACLREAGAAELVADAPALGELLLHQ